MKRSCRLLPLLALLVATLADAGETPAAVPGTEAPWPAFRGGGSLRGVRSGTVTDTPKRLWTFDVGAPVQSSAAIVGGVVYVGTAESQLLALDLHAQGDGGKLLWKFEAEGPISSSPGYHAGRIYFGDEVGYFYALEAAKGKQVWKFDTESGAEIISSANFHDDRVLFAAYDGHLFCLSTTGNEPKVEWKFLTGAPIHATPAVEDGKTFVAGCDEVLRVIDIKTGKQEREMALSGYSAASPALVGDLLYLGTFGNEVVAINWRQGASVWTCKHPSRSFPFYSSAAATDSRLVVGGRDKFVHCIDRRSGKGVWTFATKARVESSPLIVGKRVFCGGADNNLYLLDLESGKSVWTYASDGAFVASPAIGENRLVIGGDNGLIYCFDVAPTASSSGKAPAGVPGSSEAR